MSLIQPNLTKWVQKVEDFMSAYKTDGKKVEKDFDNQLEAYTTRIIQICADLALRHKDIEKHAELQQIIQSSINENNKAPIIALVNKLRVHRDQLIKLLDLRKQTVWMDSRDRSRALFYRTSQAVFIALVIYGLSWLAHISDIPLPFRSMVV